MPLQIKTTIKSAFQSRATLDKLLDLYRKCRNQLAITSVVPSELIPCD